MEAFYLIIFPNKSIIGGAAARAAPNGKNPPFYLTVPLTLPLPNIKRFLLSAYGRLTPLPNILLLSFIFILGLLFTLIFIVLRLRLLLRYILLDRLLIKH